MNISLGLIALLLFLGLFNISVPTVGQATNFFDSSPELCGVEWKGEVNAWGDIPRCCLEARKQLTCEKQVSGDYDRVCYTGSGVKYRLNNKAYYSCTKQEIW